MISIRIPKGLHGELEKISKENHFMDLSEEIRFILRKKWLEHNPQILNKGKGDANE